MKPCPGIVFLLTCVLALTGAEERLRLIVSTDIGGDSDDQGSVTRLLLYSHAFDIEGIICENPSTDNHPLPGPGTGRDLIQLYYDAYGQVRNTLLIHQSGYPTRAHLESVTSIGWDAAGRDGISSGAEAILVALERNDPRPLWFAEFGSYPGHTISIVQAVRWIVTHTSGDLRASYLGKLHFSTPDERQIHDAIGHSKRSGMDPGRLAGLGIYVGTGRPIANMEQIRYVDGPQYINLNSITTGHGPLGAIFKGGKEGDSNSIINLLPTGYGRPDRPDWGSLAGRFIDSTTTFPSGESRAKPYFGVGWNSNNSLTWPGDGIHRLTDGALFPQYFGQAWYTQDTNYDFLNRADWMVATDYAQANHHPQVMIDGVGGRGVVERTVGGASLAIDASGTSDPDGDDLTFQWRIHQAAGTFQGDAAISGDGTDQVTIALPSAMQAGETLHVLVRVIDDDSHRSGLITDFYDHRKPMTMAAYRRIVITKAVDGSNTPPMIDGLSADPGSPITGTSTTLQVSADDADGDSLDYTWSIAIQPAGAAASLDGGSSASPTLSFDRAGSYTLQVTVADGRGGSAAGSLDIIVAQQASQITLAP